ncbi:hypothetical protein GCT13_10980 [Paraburkholderia sp. CNPSo 3157]|uniref:PXPV repeat-containing protein n=1 Tax=Paraburkholderia franconis TaxID=2654983 RepID=A0A7X1N8P4_9BURK|nr:hypothetical protein [Paraburkholderia franconis]MPW17439.1 hypothetical protein [Paraburkholderia franconis]
MPGSVTRLALTCAAGFIAVCSSTAASAHVDVGVTFGIPAPVYVEPPPVVYEAPPPVMYEAPPPAVYAPSPVYYDYGYGYHGEHWLHDHGRHRGWHHHHDDDDD